MRLILDEVVDQRHDSIELTKTLSTVGKRHNTSFWSYLKACYNAPLFVLGVLFSSENPNSLQLMVPTPEKVICWQNEKSTLTGNCWNHVLENVGLISSKPSYSNTLLAVLSGTFFGHFASKEHYPNSLTIAMPTRVEQEGRLTKINSNLFFSSTCSPQLTKSISKIPSQRLCNSSKYHPKSTYKTPIAYRTY